MTTTFDRNRQFCKSVAIGARQISISGKAECGGILACGLVAGGFRISVFFIFGSMKSACALNGNSNTKYFKHMCLCSE